MVALERMKKLDILRVLKPNELENLSKSLDIHTFNKGQKIYKEGMISKYVYIILEGSVKVGVNTINNNTIVKEVVSSQEIFGENVFIESKLRNEFVQTITSVELVKIPIKEFKILVMNNPEFYQVIMAIIMNRLYLLEERMKCFVFFKAKKRIKQFLMSMSDKQGIKIGLEEVLLRLNMSQKEIALLTDTSRQTVARVLGELKNDNIIHFTSRKPGRILIRNLVFLSK